MPYVMVLVASFDLSLFGRLKVLVHDGDLSTEEIAFEDFVEVRLRHLMKMFAGRFVLVHHLSPDAVFDPEIEMESNVHRSALQLALKNPEVSILVPNIDRLRVVRMAPVLPYHPRVEDVDMRAA